MTESDSMRDSDATAEPPMLAASHTLGAGEQPAYSATQQVAISALLIAVGVIIPAFSPLKIIIEPVASYTLASHVAIFVAMFVSPAAAVAVALGTTIGFLIGGFPIPIVARAASHVIWAFAGAVVLARYPKIITKVGSSLLFSFVLALGHGAVELATVAIFWSLGLLSAGFYQEGFLQSIVLLVGLGTVIHSMVDFAIAQVVWRPISRWRESSR